MKEKITVLIADDNAEFAMTLTNYLEQQEDMEIMGMAKDGNEAYDMITKTKQDKKQQDVIMPQIDG